jgi:hypothetical protein
MFIGCIIVMSTWVISQLVDKNQANLIFYKLNTLIESFKFPDSTQGAEANKNNIEHE